MKKLFLCLTTLALAAAQAATNHQIKLFQPTVINGTELKPGSYKLQLDGSKATITDGKSSVEASVKVEETDKKNASTAVRYELQNGKYAVSEIRVGGTKTKLVFHDGPTPAAGTH